MKILFIGNSATYCNDMPLILERLINENGTEAKVDSVTRGGGKLCENLVEGDAKNAELLSLLSENEYDVLFLQEHGIYGILDNESFIESAGKLISLVGAKRVIFYVPCARKEGNPILARRGWTNADMVKLANASYEKVAGIYSGEVSSAATEFKKILDIIPDAPLYAEDIAHPSYEGSCVIALTHYKTIFGKAPRTIASLNLDGELSARLMDIIF